MSPGTGNRWRVYGLLLDHHAAGEVGERMVILDCPAGTEAAEVTRALSVIFRDRSVAEVGLTVVAEPVGVATREIFDALGPDDGRGLGAGDGMTPAGDSARYELLWFICATCGRRVARLTVDEDDLPRCPRSAPHGVMELAR